MSIDDPSAKDAVVLGADLVAALGFEPVTAEPEDPELIEDSPRAFVGSGDTRGENGNGIATLLVNNDNSYDDHDHDHADEVDSDPVDIDTDHSDTDHSDTDHGDVDVDPSDLDDDSVAPEVESNHDDADSDASTDSQDSTMATDADSDTQPSDLADLAVDDLAVDDIEVVDDDLEIIEDADHSSADGVSLDHTDEPATDERSRGRFGVRGLFSRQAESVIDDSAGSTRDLFASEVGNDLDADADADLEPVASTSSLLDDGELDDEALAADLDDTDLDDTDLDDTEREIYDDAAHDDDEPDALAVESFLDGDLLDRDALDSDALDSDDEPTTTVDLTDSGMAAASTIELDRREQTELDRSFAPDLVPGERAPTTPAETSSIDGAALGSAAVTTSTVTAGRASSGRSSKKLRARKSRRVIRHIDPWSVLTFSILFHLAFFSAMLLAGVLVWNAAIAAGTVENVENFIRELADYETFEINSQQVFRAAVIISGMLTLASSVLVVLLTVVFNLISDLVGGIRITVIEEETVRVPTDQK